MNLKLIDGNYSVCRLEPNDSIPEWAYQGSFYSISKSNEELSILCETKFIPNYIKSENNWNLIKVEGPLDFSLTGILSSLIQPLATEKISIFTVSTFDTDYLLVKIDKLQQTISILKQSGFTFSEK